MQAVTLKRTLFIARIMSSSLLEVGVRVGGDTRKEEKGQERDEMSEWELL